MTPVRLRLKNFLSYGEAAPELDFKGLHVACLSGGNGQGKSALLDAITWALWGEARKSADSRKPDDDLLRIGARQMEVELTFDLGEQRYRVRRSYTKTASGKSSKPGLEVQAQVPGTDDWRPLTAPSIRETQAVLDEHLGVDYETFVNSTFLLQGRSDEFTRKKPTERKQILSRILNLGRYDRLHERASRRYSTVREEVKRLEAEASRLSAALEDVATWEADAEATARRVEERRAALDAARQHEAEARAQEEAFERHEREIAASRDALAVLVRRIERMEADERGLRERLAEAEALTGRAEAITRDHERFETLRAERAALDEKATLHHAIRQRLQDLRHELDRARRDLESEAETLGRRLADDRQRLAEDRERLAETDRVEAEWNRAKEAERVAARFAEQKAERDRLQARADQLQKRLDGHRQRLDAERTSLRSRIQDVQKSLAGRAALRAEVARRSAETERLAALRDEMESLRTRGVPLSDQISRIEADREAIARERAALAERLEKIRSVQEAECPTCGTPLTDSHRREVTAGYEMELAALAARDDAAVERREALVQARDSLRRAYAEAKTNADRLEAASAERARAEEKLAALDTAEASLAALRQQDERLTRELDGGSFLPEVRADLAAVQEQLERVPLDKAAFERARTAASLKEHYAEERRKLLSLAERVETETTRLGAMERDLASKRQALSSGAAFEKQREAIAQQERQLAALGFDAERFEAVQREMRALEGVPALVARLAEAAKTLRHDAPRLEALQADLAAAREEKEERRSALDALEAARADREAIQARVAERQRTRRNAEAELAEAQTHLGALNERLSRAARDRETLREVRRALRESKRESQLYYHLRVAFGKNGIPSLIIEETLPEIEARANDVLERLTNGGTRVALETLKEKKSGGGTKETLDIRITDEGGVSRPYETFSGGEAFRVNFALRIALSQMLAERAGTQVRTLVVDEGFGTQDKEGIAALTGAIHAIQDDFDTILVVTHLDEMKDAFPVRIEVTKRPVEGSTFEVHGV